MTRVFFAVQKFAALSLLLGASWVYVLAKSAQSDLLPQFYLLVLHFFTRKSLHFIQTLTDNNNEFANDL